MTSDSEEQPESGEGQPKEEAMDMAALLEQSEEFRSPQRGEIVDGVVMGWDRDGALVDIRAKSEGLILRHEMQSLGSNAESQLEPGTKVLVYIVHSETADGQIVLSIDKARGEQGWLTLQERFESGETFEAEVTGFNKGGLLANVEGVNAFVPLSQVVGVRPDRGQEDGGENSLASAVGRTLRLKVIEINRRRNRVILSERAALQEWRMAQKERLIQELHEGDIRKGRVSSVRNFGVFIDLGGADGLAHLSELSWERDKTPNELFKVGDEVDVYVTKIDAENKKIALSLRRANPGPWEAVVDKYREGQVVTGLVTKLVTFGAFARIEGPVEGLIHVSELVDRRIGHPKEVAREGDLLPLKIVRIERDRHRLGLSLRRARDEGEQMGYVFSEGGEVITVPDDIRDEFIAREGP
ncbi:MAG: S1 RNA-binding domain-containing protein, partial [Chloroflexi bacterium]|nr:S1 RNA-binding domain-containing protein [Chloroflexota bacterium]